MNKAKKCNKGFPCGKSCISKLNKCWANLSTDKQKLFETYNQFVNRIVGTGNDMESSIPVAVQQEVIETLLQPEPENLDEKNKNFINKYFPNFDSNTEDKVFDQLTKQGFNPDEYTQLVDDNELTIMVDDPVDDLIQRELTVKLNPESNTSVLEVSSGLDGSKELDNLFSIVEDNLPDKNTVTLNLEGNETEESKKLLLDRGYEIKELKAEKTIDKEAEKPTSSVFSTIQPKFDINQELKDENLLGEGGMGKVYQSEDKNIVIKYGTIRDTEIEYPKKLKEMGFNNVVEIIESTPEDDEGDRKIAMEKVKGVTLNTLSKSPDKIVYKEALEKTLEVSNNLHKLGVAHGDLHSANILYDPETKEVTILDFATARGLDNIDNKDLRSRMIQDKALIFDKLFFADSPTYQPLFEKWGYKDIDELIENIDEKGFLGFLKDIGGTFVEQLQPKVEQPKYVKNYKEINDEDRKLIKNSSRDEILEIVLNEEGKNKYNQLKKEKEEIYNLNSENRKEIRLVIESYEASFKPLFEDIDQYEATLRGFQRQSLSSIYKEVIEPAKGILEKNIELGKKFGAATTEQERMFLYDQYQENEDELKTLLDGYKYLNLLAFKDHPSILDSSPKFLSQDIKNGNYGSSNSWTEIGWTEEYAKELDSKYKEYKNYVDTKTKEFEDRVGIYNFDIENFTRELDYQISGKQPEDKSRYNREGIVDPNILSRGLPSGEGLIPEEVAVQKMLNERLPMMAIPLKNLEKTLTGDQEFKNLFDFKSKVGVMGDRTRQAYNEYKESRKSVELKSFNVPINSTPDQRPVYGFMGNMDDLAFQMESLQNYGDVIVEFKPEVKDNITATIDDSMEFGNRVIRKSSPVNKFSIDSNPYNEISIEDNPKDVRDINLGFRKFTPRYIEWQGGGRLNVSNLQKIYFPLNVFYSLSPKAKKLLETLGIEIIVVAPR